MAETRNAWLVCNGDLNSGILASNGILEYIRYYIASNGLGAVVDIWFIVGSSCYKWLSLSTIG